MRAFLIAAALAAAALDGCKEEKRQHEAATGSDRPREEKQRELVADARSPIDAATSQVVADELERNIPVIDIDLAKLAADYKTNEVAADDKYKDQVVRFRTAVHRIRKDDSGRPFLELQVGAAHTFVRAFFDSDAGLAALKPGQRVTVGCFCRGFVGQRLSLTSCTLAP
jgi:hypothetical protein